MLEGIEILAQTEIMKNPDWTSLFFTAMIVFILLGFGMAIIGAIINIWKLIACGVGLAIGTFIALFIIGVDISQEPTGKYEYQVTISENVSLTEFYENYEIIDQNGKIWTIRENQ
jgi:hypothetical protein